VKRFLSSLVGIPLVVAVVYLPGPTVFAMVATLLFLLALREYLQLCSVEGTMAAFSFVAGGAGVLTAGRWMALPGMFPGGILVFLVTASLLISGDPKERFHTAAAAVMGTVYIAYAFGCLIMLRGMPQGPALAMTILLVIWAGDTAAFYGGSRFGKRKLAPQLSPKKTLEGSGFGLAGSVVAGALTALLLLEGITFFQVLALSLLVALAGQAGDLVVSLWKRAKGVKDSGTLIPGHGGLLDRIDSLLLGLPAGYLLIRAMGF
jgi:phosphatidate cytidylyltransferase